MRSSDIFNHLNNRLGDIDSTKDSLAENLDTANPYDVMEFKRLSINGGMVRELMKHEFKVSHTTRKKVLDSFQ